MRIFIAGGTGVVGRRIVPLLLNQEHQVAVMARQVERARSLLPEGAQVVQGDVFDRDATARAVGESAPDLVMNQLTDLSSGSSEANARIRIDGARNLVEAALSAGVERIVTQSIAWCYEPGVGPASEDTALDDAAAAPERQTTVAAIRRQEAEASRLRHSVVLRNGMFYGPGSWYWPDGMVAELARGGLLPATPGVTSFVHVDDAAQAAVDAVEWPAGVVNVVDDEPATGLEWVPTFARIVGAPEPPQSGDFQAWERGATNQRAKNLGWTPRWASWRAGFASAGATSH